MPSQCAVIGKQSTSGSQRACVMLAKNAWRANPATDFNGRRTRQPIGRRGRGLRQVFATCVINMQSSAKTSRPMFPSYVACLSLE